MSRSTPFFNGSQPVKYRSYQTISDEAFNKLHWVEQLKLRPLNPNRETTRQAYERGDSHQNKWDMDLEDYDNFKETTI